MMTHVSTPPVACIAVADDRCRSAIVETLHAHGWSVIERPTGIHLIDAISGAILGDQPAERPGLIVADTRARGCTGTSIAHGLRDLGLHIPTVLIQHPDEPPPPPPIPDATIAVVDRGGAPRVVAQLVGSG